MLDFGKIKLFYYVFINDYMSSVIFCEQGENGCGKTSTLAKIAREMRNWYCNGEKPVIVLRFLGTSPDSSSIMPLLMSVCEQVGFFTHF